MSIGNTNKFTFSDLSLQLQFHVKTLRSKRKRVPNVHDLPRHQKLLDGALVARHSDAEE